MARRATMALAIGAFALLAAYLASSQSHPPGDQKEKPRVTRKHPDRPRAERPRLLAAPREPAVDELEDEPAGDLEAVHHGTEVRGLVLYDETPVAGATVRAFSAGDEISDDDQPEETKSGPDGRFSMTIPYSIFDLEARTADRLKGRVSVFARSTASIEVIIELHRPIQVLVTVKDAAGAPIAGAEVSAHALDSGAFDALDFEDPVQRSHEEIEDEAGPVDTDDEGRALLDFSRGGPHRFYADSVEHGVVKRNADVARSEPPFAVELVFPRGSAIRGVVVAEDNQPLSAEVQLLPDDAEEDDAPRVTMTGADCPPALPGERASCARAGEFSFPNCPAGRYQLLATEPGFARRVLAIDKKDDTNDVEVTIVLARGEQIAGRVLTSRGHPAPGWRVKAEPERMLDSRFQLVPPIRAVDSGAGGAFVIGGLDEGWYRLEAVYRESPFSRLAEVVTARARSGDRAVLITVPDSGALTGVVSFSGAPVPASYVVRSGRASAARRGDQPTFRLEGLLSGRQTVIATADGFRRAFAEVNIREGATASVALELKSACVIRGRVVDAETQRPIAGASVSPLLADDLDETEELFADEWVQTAADGTFVLEDLPAQAIRVAARAKQHAFAIAGPFELVTCAEAPFVELALERGVAISGRVLRAGRPVRPAHVRVEARAMKNFGGASIVEVMTGEDGSFLLRGAVPGANVLSITTQSNGQTEVLERELDVGAGGARDLEIELAVASVAKLIISFVKPAPATLEVALTGGARSWSRTVSRGARQAVLEGLPAGEYQLEISRSWSDLEQTLEELRALEATTVLIAPGAREATVSIDPP